MTLTGFLAYSAALGVAAAIPGPGVTALVARALGSGFRSSLAMSFGLMLGDLTYLTAVVLGLAFVAHRLRGMELSAMDEARNKTVPLGRPARPEECAGAIWFLLSDEAGYMTGQAVNFTGGLVTW
jgi:NAD(P)-dependent dehydrogenase (short-subunit alcohol dehydrogenase family)